MDENLRMIKKHSKLYKVAVRSVVYRAQQTVCQNLFTR